VQIKDHTEAFKDLYLHFLFAMVVNCTCNVANSDFNTSCCAICRSLPGNKISGPIPDTFGNLSSLTSLDLEDNLLTGQIPASLGKLSKLTILLVAQITFLSFTWLIYRVNQQTLTHIASIFSNLTCL
jgi:Leucine rich repeat